MYRSKYVKFLSYFFAVVSTPLLFHLLFAEPEISHSESQSSVIIKSHKVEEDATNNSSLPAIFEWRNNKWVLTKPWKGVQLPDQKEILCPLGHGTVIVQKRPGIYVGGSSLPPNIKGSDGDTYSVPYLFFTTYVGICRYEEVTEKSSAKLKDSEDIIRKNHSEHDEEPDEEEPDEETDEQENPNIKSITLLGNWNHWNSDRFMGYEKIKIRAELDHEVKKVEIRFSPELEAMRYINSKGTIYDYRDELGYQVNFPIAAKRIEGTMFWEAEYILPIAKSTISWKDVRLKHPYKIFLKAYTHETEVAEREAEIDITGNIYDIIYIRPIMK